MSASSATPGEFSLVEGGPAYRLLSWLGLTLRRQIILLPALAWVPVVVLTAVGGTALGHAVRLPLAADILVNVRLLLVLPHLIWLTLWGIAAAVVLVINWLATLVRGRSPALANLFNICEGPPTNPISPLRRPHVDVSG